MTDLYDQASETEALALHTALLAQQAKAAATVQPVATGECLNPLCGEELEPPKLFCGPDCAREHARRSK
jgi:hypothetical protein